MVINSSYLSFNKAYTYICLKKGGTFCSEGSDVALRYGAQEIWYIFLKIGRIAEGPAKILQAGSTYPQPGKPARGNRQERQIKKTLGAGGRGLAEDCFLRPRGRPERPRWTATLGCFVCIKVGGVCGAEWSARRASGQRVGGATNYH